jgi:uncharacterized phiE125 gp8 family phage protein/SPP1 family predicted phage head-tail adaptor
MITWPSKNPAEVEDFLFDFTDALQEGETIATRAVTVTGATKDSDAIVGVDPGTANGVRVWISGRGARNESRRLSRWSRLAAAGRTARRRSFPSVEEPVSLVEAKAYLRVNAADEDAKIAAMIPRARKWVEDHTGLALMQRTFVERHLPRHGAIALYKGPLLSVDDVTYTDSTGDQTYVPRLLAAEFDHFPGRQRPLAGADGQQQVRGDVHRGLRAGRGRRAADRGNARAGRRRVFGRLRLSRPLHLCRRAVLRLSEADGVVIRGQFDRLVTFQRATVTTDTYGGETLTWGDVEQAYARVRFGLATEQRQAAQEGGTQTATFEVTPTTALLAVTLKDRISFDGSDWDIKEVAPLDRKTLRFTATRST